ncbi:hypothetical protein LCGC14_0845590 [marine sediment metagenome]|uniref:Uncharacterized protein n=1 Tax=marine sediment metagenome TaxID=412755 RepID=A0A0F9SJ04_9ZZZZ
MNFFKVTYYNNSRLRSQIIPADNWDDAFHTAREMIVQHSWELISVEIVPQDETNI